MTDQACRHEGAVIWNPFQMAVMCETCGEVFFRAERVDGRYVLRAVGEAVEDQGFDVLARELAEVLFSAVRSGAEMTPVERPVFEKMARNGMMWLVQRARKAQEKPSNDVEP